MYFVIFITGILALLWFTFGFSLETNYKSMKTKDIVSIASYILKGWNEDNLTTETLDETAYNNNMCILIQDSNGYTVYSYDMMANNCLIHGVYGLNLFKYRQQALNSSNGYFYAEVNNPRFNTNTLLFVMVIGSVDDPEGYIYLNTSLAPLKSTADIIKSQIWWIGIILLFLGLVIAFFLATVIEAPIVRITKTAKKMGQGNYNVKFDGHGYEETEILADTLNHAEEEISKVDTLRRDLIANVSHDLRTPLTMVKAYAEMIRDISGDNPEKRAEHLNVIIEESDRLATLVNDILDLSKLESGTLEMNETEFCITDTIRNIMERYTLLSEQKGYNFIVSADKNFIVKADAVKIQQVIYNLINNAVNYTGEDKTVYITQIIKRKKLVRIEITDTGPGIEPELIPLIFDRYYRTEKSKREVIGTGLGLSIVKQILQQHNYEFGVRSEKNIGSTFWFEMPGHIAEEDA
ncbi:MAG: sensor histidine kinase [Oscillospiraceae bacterium]